jgi:DNA polymerase III alpha subunit
MTSTALNCGPKIDLGPDERNLVAAVVGCRSRFPTPEDALAHTVLGAIRGGRRADGLLAQSSSGDDLPILALDAISAHAYLKSSASMWRLFGNHLPAALEATVVAERCEFLLPLADNTVVSERYGPARLFGLQPAHDLVEQQLVELVEDALPKRCAESGREAPTDETRERLRHEVDAICKAGWPSCWLWHSKSRMNAAVGLSRSLGVNRNLQLFAWRNGTLRCRARCAGEGCRNRLT